jgi:hypothetical protein
VYNIRFQSNLSVFFIKLIRALHSPHSMMSCTWRMIIPKSVWFLLSIYTWTFNWLIGNSSVFWNTEQSHIFVVHPWSVCYIYRHRRFKRAKKEKTLSNNLTIFFTNIRSHLTKIAEKTIGQISNLRNENFRLLSDWIHAMLQRMQIMISMTF